MRFLDVSCSFTAVVPSQPIYRRYLLTLPGLALSVLILYSFSVPTDAHVTFDAPEVYPVFGPLLASDVDGDGLLDIVTSTAVLLGDGDGRFTLGEEMDKGVFGSAGADFDGDGILDIVSARGTVAFGDGSGNFEDAVTYETGYSPRAVVTGDFNLDGNADFAIAYLGTSKSGGGVRVYVGDGEGEFSEYASFTMEERVRSIAIGDFDEDGYPDIVVGTVTTDTYLLTGAFEYLGVSGGNGYWAGFTDAEVILEEYYTGRAIVVDFDGDGHLDIVGAGLFAPMYIAYGEGDGSFATVTEYEDVELNPGFAAGDIDGDGEMDLVVTAGRGVNRDQGVLSILRGDGSRDPEKVDFGVSVGPSTPLLADFDENGFLDVAFTCLDGLMIYMSGKKGSLPLTRNYPTSTTFPSPYAGVVSDLDGDGAPDLLAIDFLANGGITLLVGDDEGGFLEAVTVSSAGGTDLAVADFDQDGILDFAAVYGDVRIFLATDPLEFEESQAFDVTFSHENVIAADFDEDGYPDLALTSDPYFDKDDEVNSIHLHMNDGSGEFEEAVEIELEGAPFDLVAADFDGDGHLDLAVAQPEDDYVTVLLGTGTGEFDEAEEYTVGDGKFAIIAEDFDEDGHTDLALCADGLAYSNDAEEELTILLNDGAGSFGEATDFPLARGGSSLVANDFDGDGHLDIAIALLNSGFDLVFGVNGTIAVFTGDGNGNFGAPQTFGVNKAPVRIVSGDFNGDRQPDLGVLCVQGGGFAVLLNHSFPHTFRRGDADDDGSVVVLVDALYLLEWNYRDGPAPPCRDAADVNDDGNDAGLLDALHLINWAFQEGPEPPAPGPVECGMDPTADSLDCEGSIEPSCAGAAWGRQRMPR